MMVTLMIGHLLLWFEGQLHVVGSREGSLQGSYFEWETGPSLDLRLMAAEKI